MTYRILVADDDPTLRASLAAVLRVAGFDVTDCSTGDDARLALRTGPEVAVAVIGVDPRVPRALVLIRELAWGDPPVRVLALAGCCENQLRQTLDLIGCRWLDKPTARDAILRSVRELIPSIPNESGDEATGHIVGLRPGSRPNA